MKSLCHIILTPGNKWKGQPLSIGEKQAIFHFSAYNNVTFAMLFRYSFLH